ncbi:hypothetical protein [Nocardia altamirensis]|uniref:hypothetical protein n=1 Tax=Nocardia altamirensis TaxID=472158 RepID=UPI000A70ACE7|nr:hypothetical protein [Nocardia altamirensis]
MTDLDTAPPRTEAQILAAGATAIRDRLPSSWSLTERPELLRSDGRADALFTVRAPDGREVILVVEAKNVFRAGDVGPLRTRLASVLAEYPASIGVVFARHLSRSTRERLTDAGLSYLDATGNLLIQAESPAVYLRDRGADADPWRGPGRPRGTLKGEPAAKVVRALLDFPGPWKIRELVDISRSSTGSVYRVIEFLEGEGLATREDGLINIVAWTALLRRWSQDYQYLHTNTITRWIAPRGLPALLDQIRTAGFSDYAVTGSIAAAAWASYAPARSAMIYTPDPAGAAAAWNLRDTDTGANVLIAQPAYPVLLARTTEALDGLRIAAPTQVAVDLMTGPGRAPSEAEELLNWMGRDEQSWR